MDDTLHRRRSIQRVVLNWRRHRRQIQRCCQYQYWLVWLAACDWILNMHINIYCEIDDINLMKLYQINNKLDVSLQDRSIQCSVLHWRQHWRRVQRQRWTIFWIGDFRLWFDCNVDCNFDLYLYFNFDSELGSNFGCDLNFDCNSDFNCNLDYNGNLHCNLVWDFDL